MIPVPSDKKKVLRLALDLVEECRHSAGIRAAHYRTINQITNTGRNDGTKSLINMMYQHLDRTASHLYSPIDLRFVLKFENEYPPEWTERGKVVARKITDDFKKDNTDMLFGQGVFEALKWGSCILKQWVEEEGAEKKATYPASLIMPWQFGVYREDVNSLDRQQAMVETSALTLPEVWRRIYHLPDARDLYRRVQANASRGKGQADDARSFFHQVLSTSVLSTTGVNPARPPPGGIVALSADPQYTTMGPEIAVDMAKFHEIWVQDEEDYVTIQLIEPDILIAPLYKKCNLLVPGESKSRLHPYTLIQPNVTTNYLWGRTELFDLMEPQGLLSRWCDDIERLFGLQIDKILAFMGFDGVTDETYDQMRGAGYFKGDMGATVSDLTPKFPPEAIPMVKLVMEVINLIGGFPPLMQGQGEQGVRSSVHANTLLKTGSPTLRDRSLLVERQIAAAADLRLSLMEIKDPRKSWTKGDNIKSMNETAFLLADIPEDRRVSVDSHSSSPIFADDHQQLTAFGVKAGFIDGHEAIDDLPFPNKDRKHQRLRQKEEKQAAQMKQIMESKPEVADALLKKQLGAGGRR